MTCVPRPPLLPCATIPPNPSFESAFHMPRWLSSDRQVRAFHSAPNLCAACHPSLEVPASGPLEQPPVEEEAATWTVSR